MGRKKIVKLNGEVEEKLRRNWVFEDNEEEFYEIESN